MIAAAIPMELDLSSPEEIGSADNYLLAEQRAAMEDTQAAAFLESPDEEQEGAGAIAGTIGPQTINPQAAEEQRPQEQTADLAMSNLVAATEAAATEATAAPEVPSQVVSEAPPVPFRFVIEEPPTLSPAIRDFSIDLRDAVLGVQEAQQEFDAQKEMMKEARENLKAAQKRFLRVGMKGIETFPLFDRIVKDVVKDVAKESASTAKPDAAGPQTPSSDAPSPSPATAATANPSTSWQSVPLTALCDLPKNPLSKKVVESLIETHGITTIGKLEAARADTMAGGLKQFKGIGQGKADKIEEAVLEWLTENRDSAVLMNVANEKAETTAAPEETARVEAEEAATATETASPASSPDTPLAETDTTSPKYLRARAKELRNAKVKHPLAPALDDQGYWEDGRKAFSAGHKLTDCSWVAGDFQDDWLRGWMAAEELSKE